MSEMIKETKLQKALAAVGRGAVYIVMSLFALMTLYPISGLS